MKHKILLSYLCLLSLGLSACGGESNSASKKEVSQNTTSNNKSLLIVKISDPLQGMSGNTDAQKTLMGHAADAIEYKHCREGDAGLYNAIKGEIDPNDQYNDIKSVEIVDKCPADAAAQCGTSDYYYTDSARVLEELKGGCGKWTVNKELKAKKAKAVVTVNGVKNNFETDTNCIERGNGTQTPVFANDKFQFSVSQYANKDWGFSYNVPNSDGTVAPFKAIEKGHQVSFDGKVMTGKVKLANTIKQTEIVEVAFEINCL